jgi:hypothetical protein
MRRRGIQMNQDTEINRKKLWLDEEFRRQFPLTAYRLEELSEQQEVDTAHKQYIEIFRTLYAASGLSEKEILDFSEKNLQGHHMGEVTVEAERQGAAPRLANEAQESKVEG